MTAERVIAAMTVLVERNTALGTEVAELRGLNDRLAARVAELEDSTYKTELRHAYRRGYLTGRNAGRRGDPEDPMPERNARGPLGALIR